MAPSLRAIYDQERGEGGNGVLHMIRVTGGLSGEFLQTLSEATPGHPPTLRREAATLQWVRLDAAVGERWRDWLRAFPPAERKRLTRVVRRRLLAEVPAWQRRLSFGLAAGASLNSPELLNAVTTERIAETAEPSPNLSTPAWEASALRRSDILGPEMTHPRIRLSRSKATPDVEPPAAEAVE